MTTHYMSPGELEAELQARLAAARARRVRNSPAAPHAGRRGRRIGMASLVAGLITVLMTGLVLAAEYSLINQGDTAEIDEAIYRAYNPAQASGSGVFDAFVQIGADGEEEGYNTDFRPNQYDEKNSATHNHSYRLSNVPIVFDETLNTLTREFQLDINQVAGDLLSLDEVEVYLTTNPNITGHPFGAPAELVYQLDKVGDDAAGDNWIRLNYDLAAGSGKRDVLLRIPQANFLASGLGDDPECTFQGAPPAGSACNTYVVLYSHFGGEEGLGGSDGFEEWGVELYELATKSGMKFNDLDADGVKDAGEPGLPGWTIYVDYNDSGTFDLGEPSDVTDASGNYEITGIVPGTYKVREVSQAGWVCSFPNAGSETAPVTSTQCWYEEEFEEGAELTGNDFGNWATATKEGRKFEDVNGDGDDEGGTDPGLGGWTINIYADADGNGVLSAGEFAAGAVDSDTTDAGTGAYSIDGLAPGKYIVCEVLTADWVQTYPGGTDECTGSATLGADGWAITLGSGQTDSGNDFGNFEKIDKTGSKYVDDEGDGSIAGDSKYTGGWTIRIYKDDGDGSLDAGDTVTSTVTDASGDYEFGDLGPGTYFVCEASDSDWIQTFPNTVAGEVIDSCDNIAGNAEFGYKFTASSGVDQTLNDFGNFEKIDKSGFKFNDNDTDGVFEPLPDLQNDTKLTGWTIELWKLVGGTWTWQATDVTDATGYSFADLGPGTYAVCEVIQTDWVQSFPYSGATLPAGETLFDCTTLTPNTAGATFAAFGFRFDASSGTDQANNNFGNFLVPPGCSLTQGYWKTHSDRGPAPYDAEGWGNLGDVDGDGVEEEEGEAFFDSGMTWYEVFWTSPKGGNAWYILAHQYMAAVLNEANDGGNPAGLTEALADAALLLNHYDGSKNIPKNADNVDALGDNLKDRAEAIEIAGFLAAYNEGTLPGTSHCGEENFVGFTTIASAPTAGIVWPIGLAPIAGWLLRRKARED